MSGKTNRVRTCFARGGIATVLVICGAGGAFAQPAKPPPASTAVQPPRTNGVAGSDMIRPTVRAAVGGPNVKPVSGINGVAVGSVAAGGIAIRRRP